jgi:hypothetical protein
MHFSQGNYDRFNYLYSNRTGDVTVTCKVKNFTNNNNSWRKGGIMFRSNLGPGSKNSMIMVTGWGIAHQSRLTESGYAVSQHDGFQLTNVWLRLVKKGNTVTSYVKKEGEYGFMRYHSVEVDLGPNYHVGLAVTMQDPVKLGTLEVANFEISKEVYSFPGVAAKIGTTANTWDNLVRVQEVGEGLWSINTGGKGIGVSCSFILSGHTRSACEITQSIGNHRHLTMLDRHLTMLAHVSPPPPPTKKTKRKPLIALASSIRNSPATSARRSTSRKWPAGLNSPEGGS